MESHKRFLLRIFWEHLKECNKRFSYTDFGDISNALGIGEKKERTEKKLHSKTEKDGPSWLLDTEQREKKEME